MKQVLESHLLHLVTRIYEATILFKTFWKFFLCLSTYPGYFLLKKYLMENTENAISETLDFKTFWVRMHPDPPYKLAPPALVCKPLLTLTEAPPSLTQ